MRQGRVNNLRLEHRLRRLNYFTMGHWSTTIKRLVTSLIVSTTTTRLPPHSIPSVANAQSSQDKQGRASFVNKARQALDILKQIARKHPNFVLLYNLTPEWFSEQEELLRRLMR